MKSSSESDPNREGSLGDGSTGRDAVRQTSEESFAASDAPSWTTLTAAGRQADERVLRRCGRLALVGGARGYWWVMADHSGGLWYWHPTAREWTGHLQASATPEAATDGLDPEGTSDLASGGSEATAAAPRVAVNTAGKEP